MQFEFSADQQLLMTSLESLLEPFRSAPAGGHHYVEYSEALQNELAQGGFLEVAVQPGFGLLEAALMVEEIATCPVSAEVAATTMIGPLIGSFDGPIALGWAAGRPSRYLDRARQACLIGGDAVLVSSASPGAFPGIDSVAAYPLALMPPPAADAVRHDGAAAAAIRRRALIGIAAEAAGLMRGALDRTVQYVKERQQFGQPLGNFQAIQHRLAECAALVRGARNLAFAAAWADNGREAALACLYAQEAARKVIHDCHQFTGAMGLTLEYPLHLWTYRLKFLQGEAGGRQAQALAAANATWLEGGLAA